MKIQLRINGEAYSIGTSPSRRLVDVLREDIGLTGTKEGCGVGECGACTVIIDRKAINSCLVLVGAVQGKEIITIEGLSKEGEIDKLQEAFIEEGAVQCGYCTPGVIMSAKALLMKNQNPTQQEIRNAIAGNICRCTGYTKIVNAVKKAAEMEKERG